MSEPSIERRFTDGAWRTVEREEAANGGGTSVILLESTNLSSAQLLDLHNTSVELLPAPGGRNYYVVHGLVLHYRFVSAPYAENLRLALVVGFGATLGAISTTGYVFLPLAISNGVGDLFKKTEDFYVSVPVTSTGAALAAGYILSATDLEDQPLGIGIDPTAVVSLTGGDSTLTVRTYYSIIDGTMPSP
jgi:hypothetical protein